jgi:hypothetical protein
MTISEKTLIPISLVLVLLGGVGYVFNIGSKVEAMEKRVMDLSIRQSYVEDKVGGQLRDIDSRLSRIEGYLEKKK